MLKHIEPIFFGLRGSNYQQDQQGWRANLDLPDRQLGLAAQGDGSSYRFAMPIIAPLARGVTMWSDQVAGGNRTRATSNADRLNHRAAIAKARV
jgi:hypothetical protein